MKKIIISCLLSIGISSSVFSQSTTATNFQLTSQTRYLGFSNDFSLATKTAGIERMHINQQAGANYLGVPTPCWCEFSVA